MSEDTKITWGAVVAGAAIVTGAVLAFNGLVPGIENIGGAITEFVGSIADKIGGWFTSTAAPAVTGAASAAAAGATAAAPGAMDKFAAFLTEHGQKLAGAALMGGGGFFLAMGGGRKPVDDAMDEVISAQDRESYAQKLAMDRAQALMKARMMAASPAHMAQFAPAMARS